LVVGRFVHWLAGRSIFEVDLLDALAVLGVVGGLLFHVLLQVLLLLLQESSQVLHLRVVGSQESKIVLDGGGGEWRIEVGEFQIASSFRPVPAYNILHHFLKLFPGLLKLLMNLVLFLRNTLFLL
jgi:hypothetical protein